MNWHATQSGDYVPPIVPGMRRTERVMGHAIAGVEGVYDRHEYRDEKADALKRLAGLVETILNPLAENVVELREAAS